MTPDLVYVVASGRANEPLRYSLRSVCAFAPGLFGDVWIVGVDMPRWLAGVRRIEAGAEGRYADVRAKIVAAVAHPDVAGRFVLMADDVYLAEPITGWAPFHMGPTSEYLARLDAEGCSRGWRRAVAETAEWMGQQGFGDVLARQGHRPLLWDKAKLADALRAFPGNRRLDVVGLYDLAGAAGVGRRGINSKVKTDVEFLAKQAVRDVPWWSTNDTSFRDLLIGDHIRAMFPDRCRYEEA